MKLSSKVNFTNLETLGTFNKCIWPCSRWDIKVEMRLTNEHSRQAKACLKFISLGLIKWELELLTFLKLPYEGSLRIWLRARKNWSRAYRICFTWDPSRHHVSVVTLVKVRTHITLVVKSHDHNFLSSLTGWIMVGDPTMLHTRSSKTRSTISKQGWESDMESCVSWNG